MRSRSIMSLSRAVPIAQLIARRARKADAHQAPLVIQCVPRNVAMEVVTKTVLIATHAWKMVNANGTRHACPFALQSVVFSGNGNGDYYGRE